MLHTVKLFILSAAIVMGIVITKASADENPNDIRATPKSHSQEWSDYNSHDPGTSAGKEHKNQIDILSAGYSEQKDEKAEKRTPQRLRHRDR